MCSMGKTAGTARSQGAQSSTHSTARLFIADAQCHCLPQHIQSLVEARRSYLSPFRERERKREVERSSREKEREKERKEKREKREVPNKKRSLLLHTSLPTFISRKSKSVGFLVHLVNLSTWRWKTLRPRVSPFCRLWSTHSFVD